MEIEESLVRAEQKINGLSFIRKYIFHVLKVGPIPTHIAFIMDGNRRYGKNRKLAERAGHEAGFMSLIIMLIYCYELGVKYVTAYAFSIDNFKRRPEEVQSLMDLMKKKLEQLSANDSVLHKYQVKVHFSGNLELLSKPVRDAVKRLMSVTANYSEAVLTVCIAYTSTDEILHAVQESCEKKCDQIQEISLTLSGQNIDDFGKNLVKLVDIEQNMYMAIAPDPDIVIRTSGENRLSNFLLWQSCSSHLVSTSTLWPEIDFWHLGWAVLNFQRHQGYFEKKKKQM